MNKLQQQAQDIALKQVYTVGLFTHKIFHVFPYTDKTNEELKYLVMKGITTLDKEKFIKSKFHNDSKLKIGWRGFSLFVDMEIAIDAEANLIDSYRTNFIVSDNTSNLNANFCSFISSWKNETRKEITNDLSHRFYNFLSVDILHVIEHAYLNELNKVFLKVSK